MQGLWHDNMWGQYPKHLLEAKIELKTTPIENLPLRPIQKKKIKMHKHVSLTRSNPKIITRYNPPNPKL